MCIPKNRSISMSNNSFLSLSKTFPKSTLRSHNTYRDIRIHASKNPEEYKQPDIKEIQEPYQSKILNYPIANQQMK